MQTSGNELKIKIFKCLEFYPRSLHTSSLVSNKFCNQEEKILCEVWYIREKKVLLFAPICHFLMAFTIHVEKRGESFEQGMLLCGQPHRELQVSRFKDLDCQQTEGLSRMGRQGRGGEERWDWGGRRQAETPVDSTGIESEQSQELGDTV